MEENEFLNNFLKKENKSVGDYAYLLMKVLKTNCIGKGIVNGKEVDYDHVIKKWDTLEFMRTKNETVN